MNPLKNAAGSLHNGSLSESHRANEWGGILEKGLLFYLYTQMRNKCVLPFWILVLLSDLAIFGCDPIHRKAFRVAIPSSNPSAEANTHSIAEALSAIDEIAKRNGMREMPYTLPLEPDTLGREYGIQISPRIGVTLRVVAHYKSREIKILLADIFKFSQSDLSKRIQDDLIKTMKDKYGENSIRRD